MSVPGFILRMPAVDYHSLQDVSVSRLKEIARSPKHYRYRLSHPRTTDPMRLGTAAHCAVLEPELFSLTYAIWGRKTDAGKMAPRTGQHWVDFVKVNEGMTIVTEAEHALAVAMANAVRAEEAAMKYLRTGTAEVTMRAVLHGRPCRGRVDWLCELDRPVLVGLKTARSPDPYAFGAAAAKLKYYWHWAMYHDLYLQLTGKRPLVKEIVVESTPPHDTVVYDVGDDEIDQGREEYVTALERLARCEQDDEWLGVAGGVELAVSLPAYVYGKTQDEGIGDLDLETGEIT